LVVFFVGYVVFEVPSKYDLKKSMRGYHVS
jgi:hypothetical protein